MRAAKVVDPARAPDKARVFFGATVKIADEDDNHRTLTLVGDDEADAGAGRIGWNAPVARALRGAAVGDVRREIGRAACRERVCQYVWIAGVAVALKTKRRLKELKNENTHKKK